jgi:integrase
MNAATPASAEPCPPTTLAIARARRAPLKSSSAETYGKALRHFTTVFKGSVPATVETIYRYVTAMRKSAPATVYLRLQAIRHEHVRQGLPSPTDDPAVRALMRNLQLGISPGKKTGTAKRAEPKHARAVTRNLLERILDAMGTNSLDRRDRCVLTLSFGAALSRSALVSLNRDDIRFTNDVMVLTIRDLADGTRARTVTVPITGHELCSATATRDWMRHAALDLEPQDGPLLRRFSRAGDPTQDRLSAAWINVVLKMRLKAVGVDPTPYSGLSLRRGRMAEIGKGVL